MTDDKRITTRNWNIHSAMMLLLAIAWTYVKLTHEDRGGLENLGSEILVLIVACSCIGYAVLTSIAMFVLRRHRWGAPIVHGTALGAAVCASLVLFAVR